MSATPSTIPGRTRRVLAARWFCALVLATLGLATRTVSRGGADGGVLVGLAVLAYNALFHLFLRHRPAAAERHGVIGLQITLDSLAVVAAIHYGLALTPAVQFLFFFPLFVATLLCPRTGLFLTAALCSVLYALATAATGLGWWPGAAPGVLDPTAGSLAAVGLVGGALLATAALLNYLVRTLGGVEHDLAQSESKYRRLAGNLEDEVRRRTGDLRQVNEELSGRNRELLRLSEIDAAIHSSADLGTLLGARARDLRIALRPGTLVEHAVRTREVLLTHDVAAVLASHVTSPERRALLPDVLRIFSFATVLGLPLDVGDDFIGLLAVGSRRELDSRHLERARSFATQAAIAVARVQQEHELTEHQAALEQAYRELQRSQEQVVHLEKMRVIGEMASGVAHNLNNLLTSILGTAQILLVGDVPQTLVHRLRLIEQGALDAASLVRRIGALTHQAPQQLTSADVNDLVDDAVAMTEPRWRHHADRVEAPISVQVDCRARQPVQVDPAAVREVLMNLILNSVLAMPEGGEILCRTWDEGDHVCLAVRDSGVGMSEETKQRCFEPFYTTRGPAGTGLGLHMAYQVVKRHGGGIEVSSELGVGTEFTVRIPVATPEGEPRAVAPWEGAQLPGRAGHLHALVVDDQPMVRETLAELLQALGHQVTLASNGPEALALFDPLNHSVVFTDWGMPEMSGLAVARAIKGRSPDTPVVLVTGFDANLPPEVVNADEIDTRLQKPLAINDLAAAMDAIARLV
ncbi:MAG: response regulator [Armatimonadetes bacterium]|nr:response regulator [Armatimonadota bacterium]